MEAVDGLMKLEAHSGGEGRGYTGGTQAPPWSTGGLRTVAPSIAAPLRKELWIIIWDG